MRWIRPLSHRQDLGVGMLILYLLFLLPVVIGAFAFDRLAGQLLEDDVRAADLALARAIALKTDAELERAIHTVEQLATYPEIISADDQGMEAIFESVAVARPEVNLIYRLAGDGMMLFHYPIGPGSTVGTDFSFRPYFERAQLTSNAVVSQGRISPTTNQPVATTVMPIMVDGNFTGVVATNLRLQSLSEALAAIASESQGSGNFYVSIIDASGQVIADPEASKLLTPLDQEYPQVVASVLAMQSGNEMFEDAEGETWLHSFAPIPSAGWGVIVRRPSSIAFRTARTFHRGVLIATAVFLLGGLFFWLALSHRVIRPLEQLASFNRLIALEDSEDENVRQSVADLADRPDQVGHLSRSIISMDRSIQRRLSELEMLLETSGTVVSTLNLQAVLDRILDQTSRLLKANTCSIVALDEHTGEFRIQASRGLSADYIRRLRINPAAPNSPTMRAIRSGQPVQIEDTESDPTFADSRQRARAEGYRALLAVPLLTQHAPQAALLVYFAEPRSLNQGEVRMVMNFANHAAMAIENATLFARSDEQLQEQTRRLESLVESMTDGLILENLNGRVLYCNRRVYQLASLGEGTNGSLSGHEIRQKLLSRCQDPQQANQEMQAMLNAPNGHVLELNLKEGTRNIALRVQTFSVTDPSGAVIGRGQLFQDISDYREIDRMKNSLIGTVSHELRTPLASIKGYASTLLAEDVEWDPQAQREFLRVISDETDRLSDLVTDLLDLSRIEAGNLRVERTPADLSELIHEATKQARFGAQDYLQLELEDPLPAIAVDRRRIEVVIRNLLENAAKYGEAESPIRLTAARENGDVVVSVHDRGPGIPDQYTRRVFEPFFRIDSGADLATPGAGLGLSICRGFIEAHGGRIWFSPSDQGTCVNFSLPIEETT